MNPNLHPSEIDGTKLVGEGNIGRIPAIGNRYTVASWLSLSGIKCVPSTSDKGLKPGMEIHRFKLVEIANDHPSWNAQAAAQCNAQMNKITADPDS